MPSVDRHFDSVEQVRTWLSTLKLRCDEHVTVTVTSDEECAGPGVRASKVRFSETPLFGLWKDRDDLPDVGRYVRQLRRPRHTDVR
jgi:hypothetical protein